MPDGAGALASGELPAASLAPREAIVALRWCGLAGPPVELPARQAVFTVGSRGCDLIVPAPLAGAVAPHHATLTRAHTGLRVDDAGTRNGTFRSLGSARRASFQIEAGERFWLADAGALALDAPLAALRPELAWCLGLDRDDAVDAAIERVAEGTPIALLGPPGTEAARLARAIHAASAQRANPFLAVGEPPLPAPAAARGATVFLELDRLRTVPAPHLRAWFDASHSVRLIVAATGERRLRACLDSYRERIQVIALPPLSARAAELGRLLARLWRDSLGSLRRVEELGPLDGLAAYRWPRNLEELREHAPRLLAYLEHGSVRAAALALGVAHQTLGDHFARIGFTPSPRYVALPAPPPRAREPRPWWGWAATAIS